MHPRYITCIRRNGPFFSLCLCLLCRPRQIHLHDEDGGCNAAQLFFFVAAAAAASYSVAHNFWDFAQAHAHIVKVARASSAAASSSYLCDEFFGCARVCFDAVKSRECACESSRGLRPPAYTRDGSELRNRWFYEELLIGGSQRPHTKNTRSDKFYKTSFIGDYVFMAFSSLYT